MSTAKIGVAVLENNGASLELEAGFNAAVKIHTATGQDIADWIAMRAESRVGLSEICYTLQRNEQFTQEEIWDNFFGDPEFFVTPEGEPSDYMDKILGCLATIMGKKYEDIIDKMPKPKGKKGSASPKKTPSI